MSCKKITREKISKRIIIWKGNFERESTDGYKLVNIITKEKAQKESVCEGINERQMVFNY